MIDQNRDRIQDDSDRIAALVIGVAIDVTPADSRKDPYVEDQRG